MRIERYVVVEDCGVMINPMIVEGQVRGGVAQGIAAALYERLAYDDEGQLVTSTLMDYLVPTTTEIPHIEIHHLETPCEFSETGAKGMGEGGTMGAPAAIASAVADASGPPGHRGRYASHHPGASAGGDKEVDGARGGPDMKDLHPARLTVNGREHEVEIESRRTLADVLRHDLGYTGTHLGCEHGICGACTVLLDGLPIRACLVFGVQADGCEVETVEGLESDGKLNRLQEAFSAHHGLQCGFCTPGFLMLATAFLRENADPTEEEIREAMSSNLCRCTGYQGITDAVRAAAGNGEAPEVEGGVPLEASEDQRVEGPSPLRDAGDHGQ